MRRAQAGDHQAYASLLTQLAPVLMSFVSRRVGAVSDREDIVQDIMMGVHKASHTYNTERPFKPWLFAIAQFKLMDHLRQHYKNRQFSDIDVDTIQESLSSTVTEGDKSRERLHDAMSRLPETQKQIVQLMKLEGYSVQDVSKRVTI
jgi:RNA polymerase sigma-70 factor, ECF subfamily